MLFVNVPVQYVHVFLYGVEQYTTVVRSAGGLGEQNPSTKLHSN